LSASAVSLLPTHARKTAHEKLLNAGDNLTVTSPVGGTVSGTAYLIGTNIFGVAFTDSVAGDDVALRTDGVFENMPKAAGAAWVQGDLLYWDNTAKNFTKTSTSNTKVGVAALAALSGDTVGTVNIGPMIG
jgi:predicted RecA/RadA family phage recombinase